MGVTGGGLLVRAGGGRVVGGDEVGCQECGSWSVLLSALYEMNRSVAGWFGCWLQFFVDLCV